MFSASTTFGAADRRESMHTEIKRIADTLKLLANETRLQILCLLIEQPYHVGALCKALSGVSQSALSQNLALLKACGMVVDRRAGQTVTYAIADARVEQVIAMLKLIYCDAPANLSAQ